MSEVEIAVKLQQLGKQYRIYRHPLDRVIDALGLERLFFWRKNNHYSFWALRNIDLTLRRGGRVGIIGRNGAGKSTMLKIIAGTMPWTEGSCEVNGSIQALMSTGTGFHPEFSGRQNIRAALSYQGISQKQQGAIEREIIEFTELDEFIDHPVKTYSLGMYARLAFTVATAIEPDLLLIDEVLGAGDAYFASKCALRMKELVEDSGSTVILVSHSTDSILRYCDQCIWLERGQIVQQGSSLEVTKAYAAFVHELEERRIKQKEKRRQVGIRNEELLENLEDCLSVAFVLQAGDKDDYCDIADVVLVHKGEVEDRLLVGGVQDATPIHPAYVLLTGSQWGDAREDQRSSFRRLTIADANHPTNVSYVIFRMKTFNPEDEYALRVRYRTGGKAQLLVTVTHQGAFLLTMAPVPVQRGAWLEHSLRFGTAEGAGDTHPGEAAAAQEPAQAPSPAPEAQTTSRWSGTGELLIRQVRILDGGGTEKRVFRAGENLSLEMTVEAQEDGDFDIIPCTVLYRLDGICVTNNRGTPFSASLSQGDRLTVTVTYHELNLDDGHYVFSVAVYRTLKRLGESEWYDLLDRSFEIKMVDGADRYWNGLFLHPVTWSNP